MTNTVTSSPDTSRIVSTIAALSGGGILPLHISIRRLLLRMWFLTMDRGKNDEPDLDDAEYCHKIFHELVKEDGNPNRFWRTRKKRFGGDDYSRKIKVSKRMSVPRRDSEGRIERDSEGNQLEHWIDALVEIDDEVTFYAGLVRIMAKRAGVGRKSPAEYSAADLGAILVSILKHYDMAQAEPTEDTLRREASHPHWPPGWESSVTMARDLARELAGRAANDPTPEPQTETKA